MPGKNCSIFGCPTSRRNKGVSIFKLPGRKPVRELTDDEQLDWRQKCLNVVTRDRIVDKALKLRIAEGNIFICEKHFQEEDIESGNSFINFDY